MADIELVIKIPTAIYEASQILVAKYDDTIQIPLEVIAKGTPLPKGHGRLKDVDKLESHDEYDGQGFTKSVYKDDIDSAQTIIEADKSEKEEYK